MGAYHRGQFPPGAKRHRRQEDLFSLLPDDCTQVIFSFLPSARDRCACAAVSKRWLVLLAHMRGCEFNLFRFGKKYAPRVDAPKEDGAIVDEEASRCLEAKEANDARLAAMAVGTYARKLLGCLSVRAGASLSQQQQQRLTDFGLQIVSRSFPNLRSLSLWDCFKVGSSGLASIATCCRALERLDISNSPMIGDDGLVPIARNCPNLSALTLESCPLVGNQSLLALAKCSSHLESISISQCPQIGDAGVVSVLSRLPKLTRVRLARLKLGNATLEAIGRHPGKSVRVLALDGIVGLTASGLAWLSFATALESLSLCSCIAEDGISGTMAVTFRSLRHVTIRSCGFLDDELLSTIVKSTRHLESLKLDRCDRVTANGLVRAVKTCGHTLKLLHLVRCDNIGSCKDEDEDGDGMVCPLLDSIMVKNCAGIDDRFLSRLAPVCANVSSVGLVGLTSITDLGLYSLLKLASPRGERKVSVNLTGCGRITDWGVMVLARAFGERLESLRLEGCKGVGDRSLAVVGQMCGGLTELDVSGSGVSDAGVVRLVTAGDQKLQVLSVAECPGVTDTALRFLEVMCGGLVGLNVQHCAGVSAKGVESLRATLWWCDVLR